MTQNNEKIRTREDSSEYNIWIVIKPIPDEEVDQDDFDIVDAMKPVMVAYVKATDTVLSSPMKQFYKFLWKMGYDAVDYDSNFEEIDECHDLSRIGYAYFKGE